MAHLRTNKPLNELEIIQNPALGAYLLWRFGLAYQAEGALEPSIALHFLILPLMLHRPTLDIIGSTNKASGLSLLTAKIGKEREELLAIHTRVALLKELSFQSLGVAASSRLITIHYEAGTARSNEIFAKQTKLVLPERLKSFPSAAEKLGHWFNKAGLDQTLNLLKVDL